MTSTYRLIKTTFNLFLLNLVLLSAMTFQQEYARSGGYTWNNDLIKTKKAQDIVKFGLEHGVLVNPQEKLENWSFDHIETIQTQIVAGTNFKINLILQNTQNKEKYRRLIMVVYENLKGEYFLKYFHFDQKAISLVGGYMSNMAMLDEPKFASILHFGLSELAILHKVNMKFYSIDEIKSIETQVVRGTNYRIKLVLMKECQRYNVELVVYEDLKMYSLNKRSPYQLTNSDVKPFNLNRPGGYCDNSNVQNEEMTKMVYHGLRAAGEDTAFHYDNTKWVLQEVVRIQTQVVNGVNYKITLLMKHHAEDIHQTSKVEMVMYQHQPVYDTNGDFEIKYKLSKFEQHNCESTRLSCLYGGRRYFMEFAKKDNCLPGGYCEEPTDLYDRYAKILQFGLKAADMDSSIDFDEDEWKLEKILKMDKQVVRGINYRFELIMSRINNASDNMKITMIVFEELPVYRKKNEQKYELTSFEMTAMN